MTKETDCTPKMQQLNSERYSIGATPTPKAMVSALVSDRRKPKEPYSYNISAICECLRKEYFRRTPDDNHRQTLASYYSSKRGHGFEWLLAQYKYRHFKGSIPYIHDGELLRLYGTLDGMILRTRNWRN